MAKRKSNDIFDKLHPGDGFRVKRVELGDSVSLHVGIYEQGELSNPFGASPEEATVEIMERKNASAAERGETTRMELVLDSVCRYLTTGGDWASLLAALTAMKDIAIGHMTYPGYELIDSYSNTDGNYEHVFVRSGTDEAVLWVEDQFIDRKTLDQIQREQQEEWRADIDGDESDVLGDEDPDSAGDAGGGAEGAEEP